MDLQQQLESEIIDLEAKLLESNPLMPQALRKIHAELSKNPALITPLTDDHIAVIVQGLKVYTKAEIITAKAKKPSAAALKNVSIDDLL